MSPRHPILRTLGIVVLLWTGLAAAAAAEVAVVKSPNGREAWLVTEPAIPLVSVVVAFEGGARTDAPGREGTVQLMASLLYEGAGTLDAQAFKRALEDKAIRLSTSAGQDAVFLTLTTLSEHQEAAFELLRLAMVEPRFDTEAIERVRAQFLAYLRRQQQDPDTIAELAWSAKALAGHPYARNESGTLESMAAITREDILAAHKARLARGNVHIAVVGDIAAEALAARLDPLFDALPAEAAPETTPELIVAAEGTLEIIARDDPQSRIVFGRAGLLRKDPDFMAATVLNHILGGGGFSSRLMQEVRGKRGLAYGVSTWLDPLRFGGLFKGQLGTENARVAEALGLVKAEIARLRDEAPGEAELADAKAYLTGSFALRLDSNAKIANTLISAALYDLGPDYLDRRNAEIEAVTLADLRRVAARLLDPEALAIVVVGAPEGLAPASPPAP